MTQIIDILLIEDNPGDIELIKAGFDEARMAISLNVISDGEEAINFFDGDEKLPDLVLLDINLPKVSGFEVLKAIRSNDASSNIPVVVLTSSESESDVTNSYKGHANSFITKPVDINKFLEVMKSIENFWLTIVKLPSEQTADRSYC